MLFWIRLSIDSINLMRQIEMVIGLEVLNEGIPGIVSYFRFLFDF